MKFVKTEIENDSQNDQAQKKEPKISAHVVTSSHD